MTLHSSQVFNIILLCFVITFEHQARSSDSVKPIHSSFLVSETYFDESIYQKHNREKRSSEKLCQAFAMNPNILDPVVIETTRKEIDQCNEKPISCDTFKDSKFRTIDGSCNNIQHPTWGKAEICLKRILPLDYADNSSLPRADSEGEDLPNARLISNIFHKARQPTQDKFTTHFMEWGQVVAHDMTLNDIFRSVENGIERAFNCCKNGPVFDDKCVSVAVPPRDQFYPKFGVSCINAVRTVPCPNCKAGQRFHWNRNTAYHDLSIVYGNDDERAQSLRSFIRGMLETESSPISGPMLPTVFQEEACISPNNKSSCYHTGDPRVNQTPYLLTIQTYLMRFHNYICRELHKVNPHWDDERIYQEARRLNIAVAQRLTFGCYLPNVFGKEYMQSLELTLLPRGIYTKYNPKLDASVFDEFSTFAARYGHTQMPSHLTQIDPRTNRRDILMTRDWFYRPFGFRYGQFDKIALGMTVDRPKWRDQFFSPENRDFTLRRVYRNESVGMDLATVGILRGRDHGVPGYTYYLKYLFDVTVTCFDDLRKLRLMDKTNIDLFEKVYKSVHDIDVYTASFAEYHLPGGLVGPTIAAVLGLQYQRTKFGDRYWFEHGNQAGSFTPEQLNDIRNFHLAGILCATTRIQNIQRNAFFPPSRNNGIVSCREIRRLNFKLWRERISK